MGKFWSEPSPVFDMDFDSQASIQQMIGSLESGQLCGSMRLIILPLIQMAWSETNPDANQEWKLDISLELLQVLPNVDAKDAIIHRVSSSNRSMCTGLWNERKVFDIGALLRWYRNKPLACIKGESPTASAVVSLLDLLRELKEVVWWMRLGQELGVHKYTLEGIRCQYAMFGEDMCMTEMLSTWLNSRVEKPTWTEVVSAVSRAGSKRLAQTIAENHGLPLAALTEANTAVDRESHTASPAIKLLDLVRELKELRWMQLGLELGVPLHTLKSIRCQYAVQGEDMCMMEMLSTWLDSHVEELTWAEVVSAVSGMGNKRVARRIAKKHGVDLVALTEVNTAGEFSSDIMASGDPLVSLRREVGVSYKAIEDNDLQLEHRTRKKRELEADRTEMRHNSEIAQKFTKMLKDDKKSLQQKLEKKEKEIATLHAKELEYERKIGKLEVKLATAGTTKQKYKEKLRTLKQKKEELVECIEAKQREVDALSKDMKKLTMKLEGAKRELSFAQSQLEQKSAQLDEFQRELELVQDQRDKLEKQLKVQEKALEEALAATSIPVTTVQVPTQQSVLRSSGQQPGAQMLNTAQLMVGGEGTIGESMCSHNDYQDEI